MISCCSCWGQDIRTENPNCSDPVPHSKPIRGDRPALLRWKKKKPGGTVSWAQRNPICLVALLGMGPVLSIRYKRTGWIDYGVLHHLWCSAVNRLMRLHHLRKWNVEFKNRNCLGAQIHWKVRWMCQLFWSVAFHRWWSGGAQWLWQASGRAKHCFLSYIWFRKCLNTLLEKVQIETTLEIVLGVPTVKCIL